MVKLQKLVLRNFKSFRKADIPISKGFTAIVGSNGSGKTNILDGLLFALGISSMKMLRVSKLEELVNTGAVENYAKAELVLKEGDKTYSVQRMINKQGKSIYRLDGKRKTRNEISSLLLELGIRAEGHNIVVQGDTTRVIEMSPLERRQIIDELAGLQEFDEKKEEALKALQKVDNKLRDAGIVLQERENYLEQLRKDKEAASEFDDLQSESKKIKATILFSEIESIEAAEKEFAEKLAGLENERKQLEQDLEKGAREKALLREKSDSLNELILRQREKTYAIVGARLEEAKTKKALLQERTENKKNLLERNDSKAVQLGEKAGSIEKEIAYQKSRVKQIDAELPSLQKKITEAGQRKTALETEAGQKEKKLAEMEEERDRLSAELDRLNEARLEKGTALEGLQKETEMRKQAMRETVKYLEGTEAKLSEREKKTGLLSQLRKKYPNAGETLKETEKQAEKALHELKEAEAERKNIAESIGLLNKSFAACPVCEAELRKEKRQALAAKKEARLKQVMERERTLKQRKIDLDARVADQRNAVEKEKILSFETRDLPELKESLLQSRERLSATKQWLNENSPKNTQKEVEDLKQKIEAKKAALSKQAQNTKMFQESTAFVNLQQANNQLAKLEKQDYSLRQEKENIEANTEKHLQKQKAESEAEANRLKEENKAIEAERRQDQKDLARMNSEIAELEATVSELERQAKKMVEDKEQLDKKIKAVEEKEEEKQSKLRSFGKEENTLMIEKSKQEVRLADLKEETQEFAGIERAEGLDNAALNQRFKEIQKRIEELGAINMKALESFNRLDAEVSDVRKKVEKLDEERIAVVEMIEKIDVKRTSVFMQCFEALNKNFSKMFNTLFGGEGLLQLSNADQPLQSGLIIQAKHKGDSIRNIDSMSGGEKTMTALAFLFAIQLYEPAPFYAFDEADAALDKENSIKMAKIIKEISKQSQFIAITHNDPLVQEADQIIGVALNKQKSSVIGLKLREKMVPEAGA